jgi:hypothetical protein
MFFSKSLMRSCLAPSSIGNEDENAGSAISDAELPA